MSFETDATVNNFLKTWNNLKKSRPSLEDDKAKRICAATLDHILPETRVYHIPKEKVQSAYSLCMNELQYMVDNVASRFDGGIEGNEDAWSHYLDAQVLTAGERIKGRVTLPWDAVWLGFGSGLTIDELDSVWDRWSGWTFAAIRKISTRENINDLRMLGMLCTDFSVQTFFGLPNDGGTLSSFQRMDTDTEQWFRAGYPYTPYAFVLKDLARMLRRNEVQRHTHKLSKRERKKAQRKGISTAPVPFYEVTVHPIKPPVEATGNGSAVVDWTHRWDVSGHTRLLDRRGELPLSDKQRQDLEKRNYKIWTDDQPQGVYFTELARRGKPMRENGKWLAVLLTPIKGHVKGPEDKPYVPSMRVIPTEDLV
jgi:hypothetical protein